MASHFDSVHAECTDLPRAATCTCDKQTACVLVLCATRHLSLCHATPARVRFRSPTGTRVRSYKQRGFFGNYLLVLLIPHLLLCEIPLHTLLIYCRDVHTFDKAQVFISGNFVFQMLVVRSRLVVFQIADEYSSIRRLSLRLWEGRCTFICIHLLVILQIFCLNIGNSFPGRSTFDVHGWSSACTTCRGDILSHCHILFIHSPEHFFRWLTQHVCGLM